MAEPVNTGKKLHVYEADSEDVAKQASSHGAVEGGIVFVKEAGKDTGKIYKDGVAYGGGGSGEDEKFAAGSDTAGVTVGGLVEGTTIEGKSVKQVVEDIIYPEFAPYFVKATSGIACKQSNKDVSTVQEVGSLTPAEGDYVLSASSANAVGKASLYEAKNGEPSKTQSVNSSTCGTTSYATRTTQVGYFQVKNVATCAQGSTTVKTNKGNMTNKTGGNSGSRTLLSKATVDNANLKVIYVKDAQGKDTTTIENIVVLGTTITSNHTINYVYRIYATTDKDNPGTLTALSLHVPSDINLSPSGKINGVQFTCKAGVAKISLPKSYTDVVIYEVTSLGDQNNTTAWNTSEETRTDANNKNVTYKVYTRAANLSSDTTIKLKYTRAN